MCDHAFNVFIAPTIIQATQDVLAQENIKLTNSQKRRVFQHINEQTQGRLVNDTRQLNKNDVFCAVIGHQKDGRGFIEQALTMGCAMVFCETPNMNEHGNVLWQTAQNKQQAIDTAIIYFYQLNQRLCAIASAFYAQPKSKLNTIGITGTNGKTSTSQIIARLFDACQRNSAVIGTNGAGKLTHLTAIENTTPAATQLQQLLALFSQNNITDVAIEVSSHALAQNRVSASLFDIAVFTNLSRDHLDYHKTMAAYGAVKKQIFTGDSTQIAIINGDDAQAKEWLATWSSTQPIVVYGRRHDISDYQQFFQATNIKHHSTGLQFTLKTEQGEYIVESKLLGDFNVDNLLAAIAVLMVSNIALKTIVGAVKNLSAIPGRMETFTGKNCVTAVVDYAHTPDALANALAACRLHCQGKLWLVFGCGGNRDQGKRILMAQVAEAKADHIIVTNDNPRNEQPEIIADQIMSGFSVPEKVMKILDRKTAVLTALQQAKNNDMVLCAGKGHENFIIVGDDKQPYSEREVVNAFYDNNKQNKPDEAAL